MTKILYLPTGQYLSFLKYRGQYTYVYEESYFHGNIDSPISFLMYLKRAYVTEALFCERNKLCYDFILEEFEII